MSHLATDLRNLLERTVVEARDVAELGALAALEALGVSDGKVHAHLKPEERDLRVRLRARARQLGDPLDAKTQVQAIDHLVREVAYEHWHRMLFARFLAESHLLVEPETGVAVSLDECLELARDRSEDPWALAGRFAERMLPAIFRSNDPALALALPPERLNRLEALLEALPAEVFAADDALGWVYQFWQSKRKKEVNASGRKIGAEELPAVTQLFTEPYMVQFLLHNTLGAWHAGKVLAARPELAASATSEDELRRACSLPGYDWAYLRFVRDPAESGPWRPAAGTFPGWPARAAEVTFMDPCCGSGHFLVEVFSALVALRQHEERLDLFGSVRAVLTDNLHGLELDPRCTQLAAFAVAFAAWRMLGRVAPLPPLHIACSGLAVGLPQSDWTRPVGDDSELRRGLELLHSVFADSDILGSLLDPRKEVGHDLHSASFDRIEARLLSLLGSEKASIEAGALEIAVEAAGLARATSLLLRRFTCVLTNYPYLARGKQEPRLRSFCDKRFPESKNDLATCFFERCLELADSSGTVGVVSTQNWLFLPRFTHLRKRLLRESRWKLVARLGEGAFQSPMAAGAFVGLLLVDACKAAGSERIAFINVEKNDGPRGKATALLGGEFSHWTQESQLRAVDSRIVFADQGDKPHLAKIALSRTGTRTADNPRFLAGFWEVPSLGGAWRCHQSTVDTTEMWGGRQWALRWDGGAGELQAFDRLGVASIQGEDFWGRDGVLVSLMRSLPVTRYTGEVFDMNCGVIIPVSSKNLPAIWSLCSSSAFATAVRQIDQQLKLTTATLLKIPIDLPAWAAVAQREFPIGLPEPWSEDPTQWIFHGDPARSIAPLQVALARLLGYRWPAEADSTMRLSVEARDCVKRSEELVGLADRDGIVCLSSLRNEEPASVRLRGLLAAAFGREWNAAKERELVAATPGQAASLEEWLRDRFFEEHCALFHQRPFIWHVCDGRKDGFHALVNYHRLAEGNGKGRQLLEALAYAYLGEWIDRQRRGAAAGETGAEARLAAAVELQGELKKILDGEDPYDIFVRWKPLHRQPIGWEPDIDDGVRLNARPFLTATVSAGRAGAGLFRAKPNIHWKKDRGAEPQRDRADFPWFYGCDGKFHGERHNDLHLSLDEKRRAREAKSKGGGKR